MTSESNGSIAIVGGRTGGHLFPALAVAESIKKMNDRLDIYWIGTADGMEARIVPESGFEFHAIPAAPFSRSAMLKNLVLPFVLSAGTIRALSLLRRHKTRTVFATGGFVCVPALAAASLRRMPIYMQEQNSFPGLTTRLFAKRARRLFAAYDSVGEYLDPGVEIVQTGNPLRPGFEVASRDDGVAHFGLDAHRKTLLVFGGSQGAEAINEQMDVSLERLASRDDIQVIWQTGKLPFDKYVERFESSGVHGTILPFIAKMELAYAACDLAVCRAGAMTLAELSAAGKPSLLVPYPFAAENHQEFNAKSFEKAGAAIMILQKNLNDNPIVDRALDLLSNEKQLLKMSDAARGLHKPGAADTIAEAIISEVTS